MTPAKTADKSLSTQHQPTVLEVIRQVASDPSVDVAKFSALLSLQERLEDRQNELAFKRDFKLAYAEMPRVSKRGVQDMGSKGKLTFATYDDLDAAIRPIEAKYGFTRAFKSRPSKEGGMKGIVQILVMMHQDGHEEESEMELPPDASGSGAMNGLKAMGSARSYGKRYLTKDYWNIITSDDKDDDGVRACAINEQQVSHILDLCTQLEWTTPEKRKPFLDWLRIGKLADLQAYDYAKAEKELMRRINAK